MDDAQKMQNLLAILDMDNVAVKLDCICSCAMVYPVCPDVSRVQYNKQLFCYL
jgi:hypothetical protein